jgi:hypothetical protein
MVFMLEEACFLRNNAFLLYKWNTHNLSYFLLYKMIFLFQFNFQDFILSNTSLRLVSPTNQTVCTLACSSHRLGSGNEVMSAQQAEDLKMKEKRKREREVIVFLQFNVTIF